jgi:hypothetical protein
MGSGGGAKKPCIDCEGRGISRRKRCPESMSTPFGHQMVTLASFFRRGHLPGPGGVLDQGAKTMEFLSLAVGEIEMIESSRRAPAEKKSG